MQEQFLLPFFLNFNMSLKDPHLCDALKVQVQITGAFQVQDTFAATLHYQLAYRLQNHAFDMAVPDIAQSNDALLIQVDPGMTPMCTFVPRQLDKDRMSHCHNCFLLYFLFLFLFFFTFWAMPLPQLPKQFFFLPILAMLLPQLVCHKFF